MAIKLAEFDRCTGCAACKVACQRGAIVMREDGEGFLRPVVNGGACIGCGRCEKVCPVLHPAETRTPLRVVAAQAKDETLRLKSSSGGVFSLLAQSQLRRGGIVYGAGFDHSDWHVLHKSATTEDEIEELRGSKYVQSDVQGAYASVRQELLSGREVLFSGTPCQVAGLRRYLDLLNVDSAKLLLVDVICHAAPSPLAWRKFLAERLEKNGVGAIIRRISFRRKNCGWKRFSLSLRFANDKEYLQDLTVDPFLRGFLSELYNRPSCHQCPCRDLRSGSDITIADYWCVDGKFPDADDDKGTSLVLVNSTKGEREFATISSEMKLWESDFADALRVNPAICRSSVPHRNRNKFFELVRTNDFDALVRKLLRLTFKERIRSKKLKLRRWVGRMYRRCFR